MGAHNAKLSKSEVQKLTKNTHFTSKEINRWHKGFLNDTPSGTLSKEEFCKIFIQFFPFGDPSAFASLIFDQLDVNENGLVEFKEFVTALSTASRGTAEEKLEWSFQMYDRNHDGVITQEEMEYVVDAIYKMVGHMVQFPEDAETPQKRVKKLFGAMDTNGDGRLSLEDYIQGAKNDPSIAKALSLYDGLI